MNMHIAHTHKRMIYLDKIFDVSSKCRGISRLGGRKNKYVDAKRKLFEALPGIERGAKKEDFKVAPGF
jgi:hypothetical protein